MERKNPICDLTLPFLTLTNTSLSFWRRINSFINLSLQLKRVGILLVMFLLFVGKSWGQVAGDYGSNNAGPTSWNTPGNWVVCITNGTWAGATIAASVPGNLNNVWIRAGHTINFNTSTTINNLTILGILYRNNNINRVLTINNDFSIVPGSVLDMAFGQSGTLTLNIAGNFLMTGGSITETGSGNGIINFNKAGTQTFTKSGGTITNDINFTVNSGSIFNIGASVIDGSAGTFTLSAGATLITANPAGISSTGATGSVQVTGTRSFNTDAKYSYNGTVPQVTGAGLPATVNTLTINNSAGVTLASSLIVTNTLEMTQGNVTITGANILSLSNSLVGSLIHTSTGTIIGKFKRSISAITGTDYLLPVGTAAFYRPANFNFSSIGSVFDITAEFVSVPPSGLISYTDGIVSVSSLFSEGYWRFISSAAPASTYNLSLTGNGFSSYSLNEISRISGQDNSNATWRAMGSHGTVTGNTITRTGITNLNSVFFNYALGTGCTSASMSYTYERDITLDYTKVAGGTNLSNFPVLISLSGQNFLKQSPTGQILNANGYDIIFTDNNYNKLDHQIEYFNGTNGDYIAWVRIPTLSTTSNTIIKILYGDPLIATDPSVTSVWDSHYKGVWHLDNSSLNDFTSFNKSATSFFSPTYPAGRIYNALGLDGGNQNARVINAPNTNFSGNLTVSAWIYLNGLGLDQKIAGNQNNGTGGYKFGVYTNNKVEFEIRNAANNPSLNRAEPGGTTLTIGQWYYVAGISSDVLDSIKTFVSGIPERPFKKTGTLVNSSNDLTIGKEPFSGTAYWNGRIDELRISDEVRSNGWLLTEFNNQSLPSAFYSIGAENPLGNLPATSFCPGPVTLTFGYPAGGTYSGTFVSGNIFTPPIAGSYPITYSYTSGCGTTSVTKEYIVTPAPPAPTAPNKEYCTGTITYLQTTSGDNIRWYSGATLVSTANPFSTGRTAIGTYNYTVTQTINGCESAAVPVNLTIFASTNITSQPTGATKCVGTDVTFSITATGPNLTYQWKKGAVNVIDGGTVSGAKSPNLSLTNLQLVDAGNYTCVVLSTCGTPLPSNIAVLQVNAAPVPAINGNNLVCPYSTINYFTAGIVGHTYAWVVTGGTITGSSTGSSINVNWDGVGAGNVTVTETVTAGCFTTQNYLVNKVDGAGPAIVGCPSNITVNAGVGSCTAVVNWTEPSATDLCTTSGSLVWTKSHLPGASFTVGITTVTYTVQDQTGNTSTPCSFTVTVTDTQLPTITAPAPITVSNDAGVCAASGVVPGVPVTADNCSVASVANNAPAVFPLGPTTVIWTVTDGAGNAATATQTVTVIDNELPIALCKSITVNLDFSGNANITAAQIDNGSTDNCGIASLNVAPNTFNSSNIGGNIVTLTVTDNSGNVSTCSSTVTVLDNNAPIALCKDVTVQLGAAGTVIITGATVDNGSNDPDGIASLVVAPNSFNCSNIGANAVVLTVTDNAGKISTCNSIVTVVDNLLPTISCPGNINVNTDPGICGAVVNYLTPVGLDNCSGPVTSQTTGLGAGSTFPIGTTTNTFLVTDGSGNTATCSFTVTVTDNEKPVITLPAPPIVNANAGCQAPIPAIAATISDNCTPLGSLVISQAPAAGTMIGLGITTVTITATDLTGNTISSNINVTVTDVTKPVITKPADITLNLDNSCQALVPNFLAAFVVSDNCTAVASITNTQNPEAGTVITGVTSTNILLDTR